MISSFFSFHFFISLIFFFNYVLLPLFTVSCFLFFSSFFSQCVDSFISRFSSDGLIKCSLHLPTRFETSFSPPFVVARSKLRLLCSNCHEEHVLGSFYFHIFCVYC